MKVLMQEWKIPDGKGLISISKNHAQLDATTRRVKKDDGHTAGDSLEVEIPDDHEFVGMLENGSVFLHDDEMDVITYPE